MSSISETRISTPPLLETLGWGLFLATSWTWCIGMFLPSMLIRDHGPLAWFIFTIPNAVGAAALGWVIPNAARATAFVQKHMPALRLFGWVTIAFQCYAAGWIFTGFSADALIPNVITLLSAVTAGLFARTVIQLLSLTLVIYTLSVTIGVLMGTRGELHLPELTESHDVAGIWLLSPVIVFGFMFCPYLDLTFLRVPRRLNSPAATRISFTAGFLLFFVAMIVISGLVGTIPHTWSTGAARLFAIHACAQLGFTIAVHIRELGLNPDRPKGQRTETARLAGVLVLSVVIAIGLSFLNEHRLHGLDWREIVYRCFMCFYGLLFPAYAYLCMWPAADGHTGLRGPQGQRKLRVLITACLLACPFYYVGFIAGQEAWILAGLGIVLTSRLLTRR
ncbi:MAG: hypothetical protein AAGB51_00170 [Planctomycetota bacterium]